jgi:hypothetical protein
MRRGNDSTAAGSANRDMLFYRLAIAGGSLAVGAILGVFSVYYAFSKAGVAPVPEQDGWEQRSAAPNSPIFPYVLGHYLAEGQLPPPQSAVDLWRHITADGKELRGDCSVVLEGTIPASRWWTLAAVNKDGIAEGVRGVLSASSAILEADGSIVIRISIDPQPGNWVTPASGGTYALALTLHDPIVPFPPGEPLPTLKQGGC